MGLASNFGQHHQSLWITAKKISSIAKGVNGQTPIQDILHDNEPCILDLNIEHPLPVIKLMNGSVHTFPHLRNPIDRAILSILTFASFKNRLLHPMYYILPKRKCNSADARVVRSGTYWFIFSTEHQNKFACHLMICVERSSTAPRSAGNWDGVDWLKSFRFSVSFIFQRTTVVTVRGFFFAAAELGCAY